MITWTTTSLEKLLAFVYCVSIVQSTQKFKRSSLPATGIKLQNTHRTLWILNLPYPTLCLSPTPPPRPHPLPSQIPENSSACLTTLLIWFALLEYWTIHIHPQYDQNHISSKFTFALLLFFYFLFISISIKLKMFKRYQRYEGTILEAILGSY